MKTKTIITLVLTACAFSFLGCSGLSVKEESPYKTTSLLGPSSIVRFNDLPVPAGFKLLAQNSYSFESQGVRVGVLRYQGKANPDQIISFYREQMPMYNWNLLNVIEYGERLMNFDRENETCIVSLAAKGNSCIITISLGPKPAQSTRKSTKPIK